MRNLNSFLKEHLNQSRVAIWYQTRETFRHISGLGVDFGVKNGLKLEMGKSHKAVGEFHVNKVDDHEELLDKTFMLMQGENWSRNGEARPIIEEAGLGHTSMSVGDIVQIDDDFYACDMTGFKNINEMVTVIDSEKENAGHTLDNDSGYAP